MNDLKDLVMALDGFSIEKTGFKVTQAIRTGPLWRLVVSAYKKSGEKYTAEEEVSVSALVNRIDGKYVMGKEKWKVVKVAELTEGMYKLVVKREENEKEDCENKEEHVEDEK